MLLLLFVLVVVAVADFRPDEWLEVDDEVEESEGLGDATGILWLMLLLLLVVMMLAEFELLLRLLDVRLDDERVLMLKFPVGDWG
jgi:hypothetical protein